MHVRSLLLTGCLLLPVAVLLSRTRNSDSLCHLAEWHGLWIGAAVDHRALSGEERYREVLAREFNTVTAENLMKFRPLVREQGIHDSRDPTGSSPLRASTGWPPAAIPSSGTGRRRNPAYGGIAGAIAGRGGRSRMDEKRKHAAETLVEALCFLRSGLPTFRRGFSAFSPCGSPKRPY